MSRMFESEGFVQVAEQMDRHHIAFHVLYGVVNNLVSVFGIQAFIRFESMGEGLSTGFTVLFYECVERLLLRLSTTLVLTAPSRCRTPTTIVLSFPKKNRMGSTIVFGSSCVVDSPTTPVLHT
jgi:hypothetical protein